MEYTFQVLRLFLQVPNIFATEDIRADLEAKARENLEKEVAALEAGNRVYE